MLLTHEVNNLNCVLTSAAYSRFGAPMPVDEWASCLPPRYNVAPTRAVIVGGDEGSGGSEGKRSTTETLRQAQGDKLGSSADGGGRDAHPTKQHVC
jgi:hypothetical protein